ncbi:hypothetical protein HK100_012290 [Physocladia obscura]|uniref:NAD(P)-binding protein n=1 Tax=Physocladia obscura TaxID=109957 RepID=A0AAD5XGC5_9FUNG|nr:hypothetical protein HK100_012290 [Physocladia obscura]
MLKTDSPRINQAPVTIIVIGAGQRATIYGNWALAHPALAKVVAVCESNAKRQANYAAVHAIDAAHRYSEYKNIPAGLADAAIVSTLDQSHADIVCHLASLGYHIMCEKPMATALSDCERMRDAILASKVLFACGHVLRYSPYTRALKAVLDSGEIGEIINIVHIEPVGWWHFAHSFVRGNWRNEADSSFSLMTKCCHDVDLVLHFFNPLRAVRVSSFGSLSHFKQSKKPIEAGNVKNCLDCPINTSCPYSATELYITKAKEFDKGWPVSVVCGGAEVDVDNAADLEDLVTEKLRDEEGGYGKCVYEIEDNDVCDQQVVNIEFEGGKTASLTMVAFTEAVCQRSTRIHGTKGEIIGDMSTFSVYNFGTKKKRIVNPKNADEMTDGTSSHSGGDSGIMEAFVLAVSTGDQSKMGCDVNDVFNSHALVFAAEKARVNGTIIKL